MQATSQKLEVCPSIPSTETRPMLKVNCNCALIPHSHFKIQCDKIARAQREAQWKARKEAQAKVRTLPRTTPAQSEPVPKKTQVELALQKACHGARGMAALAKSCPSKKDVCKIETASTAPSVTDAPSVAEVEEMHKTIVLETRKSVIMGMRLPEKKANELRKKLRTLYEIQVAEQTIALAKTK